MFEVIAVVVEAVASIIVRATAIVVLAKIVN